MNKTIVLAMVMCFLFSVSEIMAAGTSPRMRRALNRAWKAQMAKEKALDKKTTPLEQELEDLKRKLFDFERRYRRMR